MDDEDRGIFPERAAWNSWMRRPSVVRIYNIEVEHLLLWLLLLSAHFPEKSHLVNERIWSRSFHFKLLFVRLWDCMQCNRPTHTSYQMYWLATPSWSRGDHSLSSSSGLTTTGLFQTHQSVGPARGLLCRCRAAGRVDSQNNTLSVTLPTFVPLPVGRSTK